MNKDDGKTHWESCYLEGNVAMSNENHRKLVGAVYEKLDGDDFYSGGLLFERLDGSRFVIWMSSRGGKIHEAVWKAGAEAAIAGKTARENPYYFDKLDCRGRISLGRRGFRNAWDAGYEDATREMKRIKP